MGRPKKIKSSAEETQEKIVEVTGREETTALASPEAKQDTKKTDTDNAVLIKTMNYSIVRKAKEIGIEATHISGNGSSHNPKWFFIIVPESKFIGNLTEDELKTIEEADPGEIGQRVKESRDRGAREYSENNAKRRKLNAEIQPSEFFA